MKIYAHTLVKNEERYLWFAVTSVIDHVDKVLLWDTGSTDNTQLIAKELVKRYGNKIDYRELGDVDINEFTQVRQQMLEETDADWFIIVDGDEVWWKDSIESVRKIVEEQGEKLESLISSYYNVVGDIYHFQEEVAGKYMIDGITGHLSIRAMSRKIPGLHLENPHGTQGFFDNKGKLIQDRSKQKRKHMGKNYLHFTHMIRSSNFQKDLDVPKRKIKYKYELGIPFPKDFYYPESFFLTRPEIVKSPWEKFDTNYLLKSLVQTPLRKMKRRVFSGGVGY